MTFRRHGIQTGLLLLMCALATAQVFLFQVSSTPFSSLSHVEHAKRQQPVMTEFITVWNSANPGGSGANQINFPGVGLNYSIYWELVSNPSINGNATGFGVTLITFPAAGIYRVYVIPGAGTFTQINFSSTTDDQKILEVQQWGTIPWASFNNAFNGCQNLQVTATDIPDLSGVTDMTSMFRGCSAMTGNGSFNSWDVSTVTHMGGLFSICTNFNADISSWNTAMVISMASMFAGASNFNQDLSGWDVGAVTSMSSMFNGASSFNADISSWDVSDVTTFSAMFQNATSFNADLGGWDVGSATNMLSMFRGAANFNANINGWDVNGVTSMNNMFLDATAFNQPLNSWDVSTVSFMFSMFQNASSFDQNLGNWTLHANVNLSNFLSNSGMSCAKYDSTLVGWNANPLTPNSRSLGATGLNFWLGLAARSNLIISKGWMITGDSYSVCNYPPNYEITTTGGHLVITDLSGSNDVVTLEESGNGDLTIDVSGRNYALNGGALTPFPVDIVLAGIDSITINLEAGNDHLECNEISFQMPALTVNGGTGDDQILFNDILEMELSADLDLDLQNDDPSPGVDLVVMNAGAELYLYGLGSLDLKASRNLQMYSASIFAEDGDILIETNQQAIPTSGDFYGVGMDNSVIEISSEGELNITGKGGDSGGAQIGLYLYNGSQIRGPVNGMTTITGYGGPGTGDSNRGLQVQSAGSQITTNGGDLQVIGYGNGTGTSGYNYGVHLVQGGVITAGNDGDVLVEGTGGDASGVRNRGVYVLDPGSTITSSGGNVMVTGYGGGTGNSNWSKGVLVENGGIITAGGNGTVTVVGTGAPMSTGTDNMGVHVDDAGSFIRSNGGNVSVTGYGSGTGSATYNYGVFLENGGVITGGGNATVTVNGTGGAAEGLRNDGVVCWLAGSMITSEGGDVFVTGQGGGIGASYWNFGVYLVTEGKITAGGTGNVYVQGTGGDPGGERNYGVYVHSTNAMITSGGGNVEVYGYGGGNDTSFYNIGVLVRTASITAGGIGNVYVYGEGGLNESNRSDGVQVWQSGIITSSGGNVHVEGQGGGTGNTDQNFGVIINANCAITAGGSGDVLVEGTGGATSLTRNDGIYIVGNGLITSTMGNVRVVGQGGGSGTAYRNYGVFLDAGGVISAGGNGEIEVEGYGGLTDGYRNYGVVVSTAGSEIESNNGNITITGVGGGGAGTSDNNYGVYLTTGTVTAGGNGSISIHGTGGEGVGSSNYGVGILGGGSSITTNDGDINITCFGGGVGAASTSNYGIRSQGVITAGGAGVITVSAIGGDAEGNGNTGFVLDGAASQMTTAGGDITIIGQGGGSDSSSGNSGTFIVSGSMISPGGTGNLNITATGGNTAGSTNMGFYLSSAGTQVTTAGGNVLISGTGGGGQGGGNHNYGVNINGGAELSAGGSGTITMSGTGGGSTGGANYGMIVFSSNSTVTTANGNINITAQGGGVNTGGSNVGCHVQSQGSIHAGGTGNINILGTGGPTSGYGNHGILVWHDGSFISTTDGDINLTGLGNGVLTGETGWGVVVAAGRVEAGGTGNVTLHGTGSPANGTDNGGVAIQSANGLVTTGGGDILITGIEGSGPSGYGFRHMTGARISTALNTGNIIIEANSMAVSAEICLDNLDTLFLHPYSPGVEILLGPAGDSIGNPLQLSDMELDSMIAKQMIIGSIQAGSISIDSNITRSQITHLNLVSGSDVIFNTGGLDCNGGNVFLDPGPSPAAVIPIQYDNDVACGQLSFGSDLMIEINGTIVDMEYTQLNVIGQVDLNGVELVLNGSHNPGMAEEFIIINNDDADAVAGTFVGLPEGATFPAFLGSGFPATISYFGGDGNDVVITVSSPDYLITNDSTHLIVTDLAGNSDVMNVSQSGLKIRFNVPGRTFSLNGAGLLNLPADIGLAGLDSITINLQDGDDDIGIYSFTVPFPTLDVNGGLGDDLVGLYGNITFIAGADLTANLQDDDINPGFDQVLVSSGADLIVSDTGKIDIQVSGWITMNNGTRLQTQHGELKLESNMQPVPSSGSFYGLSLSSSAIVQVTGSGPLTIRAKGGDSGSNQSGVYLNSESEIIGGTSGLTTVEGYGGAAPAGNNQGVVCSLASLITSDGADVHVTGTGGGGPGGSSSNNYGVYVLNASEISAGGMGDVTVTGTGGPGGGFSNHGVTLFQFNSTITAYGGNVNVTGTGGGVNTSGGNRGIHVDTDGVISAQGSGHISLTGYGGDGAGVSSHDGIFFGGTNSHITTSGGNITLTGYGGGSTTTSGCSGVNIFNSSISTVDTGSITLNGSGGSAFGSQQFGVAIAGNDVDITTFDGNISIIGEGGGSGASANNVGVYFSSGIISSNGMGDIFLEGTGGPSIGQNQHGIQLALNGSITSSGGNVALVGEAGVNAAGTTNCGVILQSGANIQASSSGQVSIDGTSSLGSGIRNNGVYILNSGSGIFATGADIVLSGQGGGDGGANSNVGVEINFGAEISTMSDGDITIDGTGGNPVGTNNHGIYISGDNTNINTINGQMVLTGQGGGSFGSSNMGIFVSANANVESTGEGNVTLSGTGSLDGSDSYGVYIQGTNTSVQSFNGDLSVFGFGGGSVSGFNNYGLTMSHEAVLQAMGSGNVTIEATGGNGPGAANLGVYLGQASPVISSGSGSISITCFEGEGSSSMGLFASSGSSISSSSGGDITVISNSMFINSTIVTVDSGSVTFYPLDTLVEVDLGTSMEVVGGPLSLADAELDLVSTNKLIIGHEVRGAVSVKSPVSRSDTTHVILRSGNDVVFDGGWLNTAGGNVLLEPGSSPAAVKAWQYLEDIFCDTVSFGSDLLITIDSTIVDSFYTQLHVHGNVDLTGVDLILEGMYSPMENDSFVIVNNDSMDAIIGIFNGLMEGDTIHDFLGDTLDAIITYVGNDGNDAVIRVFSPCAFPSIPVLEATLDTICEGTQVQLSVISGDLGDATEWHWYSSACGTTLVDTGPVILVTPSATTTYYVRGEGGCVTTPDCGTITIQVNAYPDPTIDQTMTSPCYFTDRIFQPDAAEIPGATYSWTFGSGAVPDTAVGYGPHTVYYTTTGSKNVKLVIHPNAPGPQCPDSSTLVINVTNCPGQLIGRVTTINGDPMEAVNIKLFADADTNGLADNMIAIRNVNTPSTGFYAMAGLTPGNYVIVQTQPTNWLSFDDGDDADTTDLVENIDSLDNLIPVTILPFETDTANNFVERPAPGTISGKVFHDLDVDMMPDPGEGLADVTVSLFADADTNGVADNEVVLASQVTDAMGNYMMVNIPVGHYVLVESPVPGFVSIKDFDPSVDGDIVPNVNMNNDTLPVTMSNGEHDADNFFIDAPGCALMVTNTLDSGPGSLRAAINCAMNGDTITFHPVLSNQTIVINSTTIDIDKQIVIASNLVPRVTLSSSITGFFNIQLNGDVEFIELNIISGLSPGNTGAAFEVTGILRLKDAKVTRNPLFATGQYLVRVHPNGEVHIDGMTEFEKN